MLVQPQLIARDLFQSFRMGARRIEVLRGISMDISNGEAVFLSGASGAGKTTLLYTLAGLEQPESGTVKFEGRRLYAGSSAAQARLRNEKMGFVFQGYFLLPELTALENVLLPAMIGRQAIIAVDRPVISIIRIWSIAPCRIPVARIPGIPSTVYENYSVVMAAPPVPVMPL